VVFPKTFDNKGIRRKQGLKLKTPTKFLHTLPGKISPPS
jgi:hypothetical protein